MFTAGLVNDIHIDVKLQGPHDLEHACALARAYEQKTTRPPPRSTFRHYQQPQPPPAPAPAQEGSLARPVRRLTPTEMNER
jgi:hypothetical protein